MLTLACCLLSMEVLKGSLKETLYNWPDRNVINDGGSSPLIVKKETIYTENRVTYMSDNVTSRNAEAQRH